MVDKLAERKERIPRVDDGDSGKVSDEVLFAQASNLIKVVKK